MGSGSQGMGLEAQDMGLEAQDLRHRSCATILLKKATTFALAPLFPWKG